MFSTAQVIKELLLSHFDLSDEAAYQRWRTNKLAAYPLKSNLLLVPINDYTKLTQAEINTILHRCRVLNFAIYRLENKSPCNGQVAIKIAKQLGFQVSDRHLCADQVGLSEITVSEKKVPGEYIPYTNKFINWHTDGYYNAADKQINSMILHCGQQAKIGGDNNFFDHEILYILLRDENPDYIDVLMQNDVMTIPENRQDGQLLREAQTGPVFRLFPWGLHMRYTARTRSIQWKSDSLVKKAVDRIQEILNTDSIYKIHHRFAPGEGVVSHNILHMRDAFEDYESRAMQRLIYRIRFYQRLIVD